MQRIYSLFWSDPEADKSRDVKPQDQILDIQKVKFDVNNETHRAYIQLKLKEFSEKSDQLTDADQKIAAASGLCLLFCVGGYSNFLSLAGYGCLIYFATQKTQRNEKSKAFFAALDEIAQLNKWCRPEDMATAPCHPCVIDLAKAMEPYNLDKIDKSKYTHFFDTAKTAAATTKSALVLTVYGKRFHSPDHETLLPSLK